MGRYFVGSKLFKRIFVNWAPRLVVTAQSDMLWIELANSTHSRKRTRSASRFRLIFWVSVTLAIFESLIVTLIRGILYHHLLIFHALTIRGLLALLSNVIWIAVNRTRVHRRWSVVRRLLLLGLSHSLPVHRDSIYWHVWDYLHLLSLLSISQLFLLYRMFTLILNDLLIPLIGLQLKVF